MLMRLLKADLARGAVVAATLTALIALAATLMSAGTSLVVDSLTATSRLSQRAKLPDLVQMHTGQVNDDTLQAVDQWAQARSDVTGHEVIKTLPVPRQELSIDGVNQSDSYNEPAFVTSPKHLDLLLDDNGSPVAPGPGEVVLPIHYRAIKAADVGDTVTVSGVGRTTTLRVVGFARDAQMNAAMIPSKRLVVSPEDFSALEQQISEPEYLIELDLATSARPGSVIEAYKDAGLPSNGIDISASMIQLMNSLNVMLIVAVALVVAIVLAVVAILALRYTVLAAIETDLAQIAALKAIGAPQSRIRRLYVLKYLALSAAGATVGYLAGLPLAAALEAPTTLYLGRPPTTVWSVGLPVIAVLVLAALVIGFTWLALRRIGRISAVEALRSGTSASLRTRRQHWRLTGLRRLPVQVWLGAREALRPSNALLLGVLALCTLTMILPANVSTTLSDPRIATYLGVGQADLRIDVRTGVEDLATVEKTVDSDPRVSRHTTVLRRSYKMSTSSGSWETVLIDIGDHDAFPMKYVSGRGPTTDNEVSLSYSQAQAAGAQEGSTVTVQTTQGDRDLTVTGIYQDITNNGKTAKATFDDGSPALWQIIYADAHSPDQAGAVAKDLSQEYPGVQAIGMNQYASQLFGATGAQVRLITTMACAIALGLSFLITVLFTVLIISRERPQTAVLLALGCTRRAVAGQYFIRFGILALAGVALGLLAAFTVGGSAIGALMATRGAPDLQLLPNPWLVGIVLPGALLATVIGAVALALRRLRTMPLSTTLTTGE
ncbi:ABC transporter permease [Actinomyces viscosus]|uniref:FtsX-like permease family n=1 Tax=Actinomyces viscosus TaxID=1656 RepID=A0A448PJY5_ACTVI|nr:FtsX-like permease family protein [Actinomyces viscosus]TFH54124.1 ABC transporter permease [Actinomyces viscosus]VEI15339.1 FtsX-like permease family [Actinomyces viscosus]